MHWSSGYIGLPWQERGLTREGIACWGLPRLVYAEQLGIDVPDYSAAIASTAERDKVAATFVEGTTNGPWLPLDPAFAREFDILVFRIGGIEAHVGIVTEAGRMLHITSGQESCIAEYTRSPWAHRLAGVYRHEDMLLRGVADPVDRVFLGCLAASLGIRGQSIVP